METGDAGASEGKARRDPLLVALPAYARSAVVLEVQTFVKTPIGAMVLRCIESEPDAPRLDTDGFSLDGLERLAIVDPREEGGMMIASGSIASLDLERLVAGGEELAYGDKARVFTLPAKRGRPEYLTLWNDQLLMVSRSLDETHAAVDRLEGRRLEPAALDPDQAYGEAYGRVISGLASGMLPAAVGKALGDADLRFGFHFDASHDALRMLDATGSPERARDVGRAAAAALAARRLKAVADKDERLTRLLDFFRVKLESDGFLLDAAFPVDFVRDALGTCATRQGSDAGRAASAGSGG